MDTHVKNDPNNPNNWNGKNKICSQCSNELDWRFDYEEICINCHNQEEPEEEEETQNK